MSSTSNPIKKLDVRHCDGDYGDGGGLINLLVIYYLINLIKKYFKTVVFAIAQLKLKKLLLKKDVCDYCMALLENEDQINPRIHINWTENKKYRVFSNFYCAFLDRIFRHESIKNKCGEINNETINKHINAHINDSFI